MARKRTHRVKKIEPAVMRLAFTAENEHINGENYIDLSQAVSLLNRRFYRQGLNWAVGALTFVAGSAAPGGVFYIEKLPNTWVMSNAWEKGFRAWKKMNDEALIENESIRPRFLDFKIYADSGHHQLGFVSNMLPGTIAGGYATPGEWDSSKMSISQSPLSASPLPAPTNDYEILAVGANYPGASLATALDAVSLIEGYANSRALPALHNPNVPDDAADTNSQTPENWIAATFNEGTDQSHEVLENLDVDNARPPYPYEGDSVHVDTMYPNGATQLAGLEFHDQVIITGTTVSARNRSQGGNFPCGLIKITSSGIVGNWNLFVDLVPGNHRGYLCEPMTEM